LSLQKQEALKAVEQQTEEKTRREADLERDLERLRSQLKFKEHELTEIHGMLVCTKMGTWVPGSRNPFLNFGTPKCSF